MEELTAEQDELIATFHNQLNRARYTIESHDIPPGLTEEEEFALRVSGNSLVVTLEIYFSSRYKNDSEAYLRDLKEALHIYSRGAPDDSPAHHAAIDAITLNPG
jgi:hypothetical protein